MVFTSITLSFLSVHQHSQQNYNTFDNVGKADTFKIFRPLFRVPIISAPIMVPKMRPLPPERLVPPNTTAAIASAHSGTGSRLNTVQTAVKNSACHTTKACYGINKYFNAVDFDTCNEGNLLITADSIGFTSAGFVQDEPQNEKHNQHHNGRNRQTSNIALAEFRKRSSSDRLLIGLPLVYTKVRPRKMVMVARVAIKGATLP